MHSLDLYAIKAPGVKPPKTGVPLIVLLLPPGHPLFRLPGDTLPRPHDNQDFLYRHDMSIPDENAYR